MTAPIVFVSDAPVHVDISQHTRTSIHPVPDNPVSLPSTGVVVGAGDPPPSTASSTYGRQDSTPQWLCASDQ